MNGRLKVVWQSPVCVWVSRLSPSMTSWLTVLQIWPSFFLRWNHNDPSSLPSSTSTPPHLHLQVNVFVLLSVVCVLLNLAGFILCCQGAQLVSSMTSCRLVRMLYCNILMSSKSLGTLPNPVFMFRFILLRLCIIKLSSPRTRACSYRRYTTFYMWYHDIYVILHQT